MRQAPGRGSTDDPIVALAIWTGSQMNDEDPDPRCEWPGGAEHDARLSARNGDTSPISLARERGDLAAESAREKTRTSSMLPLVCQPIFIETLPWYIDGDAATLTETPLMKSVCVVFGS